MALSDTTNTQSNQTEKPPSETHRHDKREKPATKVVIRRLPPSITQDEFITQVSPIPDYDYIYAVKGDMTLGENSFSRVYINFIKSEDVYLFKEKFDNYVFVDAKGHEYAAVVEFAAFQKIPKKRGKPRPDPKIGSIKSDSIYIEFLESLKQQPNQEEKPEFSYQPSNESKTESSTTPLLDYIKQRKIDKLKSKEEKREERRKREMERKRMRDEERQKRFDEKSPAKSVKSYVQPKSNSTLSDKSSNKSDIKPIKEEEEVEKGKTGEKFEKNEKASAHKAKEVKKYDDLKPTSKYKSKFQNRDKYEPFDKRDFKSRRDDYRDRDRRARFDEHRKDDYKKEEPDVKQFQKKVKKYSERREERKYEVKKAELKKDDASNVDENKQEHETTPSKLEKSPEKASSEEPKVESKVKEELRRSTSGEGKESDDPDKSKNKENDPRVQRRIRNKDRPTMQLYQPGMLSKRKQQEDDKDVKETSVKD